MSSEVDLFAEKVEKVKSILELMEKVCASKLEHNVRINIAHEYCDKVLAIFPNADIEIFKERDSRFLDHIDQEFLSDLKRFFEQLETVLK
jgi:hypothetical protein